MNRYAYRIHYQQPAQKQGQLPMDAEAVHSALRRFRESLPLYLHELNASAELPQALQGPCIAMRMLVHTDLDWANASLAMTRYADRHNLRATRVLRAPPVVAPRKGAPGWLLDAFGSPLAPCR